MEVDYSWSMNGTMLKTGRKANLVYVNKPGQYQCVVTVNDHVAKSQVIDVVEERSNIAAKEEDNPIDPLALLQSDANSQEKDGINICLYICGNATLPIPILISFINSDNNYRL